MTHIAILHNILLPFHAYITVLSGFCHAASAHQVIISNDFSADEAALNIGMNNASRFNCWCTAADCPGGFSMIFRRIAVFCCSHVSKSVIKN